MSTIKKPIDMLLVDDLFAMGSGYVLNFSDRTFAEFFAHELNIELIEQTPADAAGGACAERPMTRSSRVGEWSARK